MTGKLLNLNQCAERTGHRVSTWRAWVLLRKVPYFKIGGSVRIAESDVEEMLKNARIPAREQAQ